MMDCSGLGYEVISALVMVAKDGWEGMDLEFSSVTMQGSH